MEKNIEVEIRAEIKKDSFEKTLRKLKSLGTLSSKTRRLSVMFFGKTKKEKLDVRVRITNGKSEVVIKKGSLHSHNRIEVSQPITKKQFLGMVKLYNLFDFDVKVGERETYNFDFCGNIVVSLVKAGEISYLEIEKISSKNDTQKNLELLTEFAKKFNVAIIKTANDFDKLCDRLSKGTDWKFNGEKKAYEKIKSLLEKY